MQKLCILPLYKLNRLSTVQYSTTWLLLSLQYQPKIYQRICKGFKLAVFFDIPLQHSYLPPSETIVNSYVTFLNVIKL
jgi:diphthamide biosynthesis methyltransferase